MGMVVAGVFLVIVLIIIGVILLTAFILLICGIVGIVRDRSRRREYERWAALQPVPAAPYKTRKAPRVLLGIALVIYGTFAALIIYGSVQGAISRHEYEENRNLFSCLMDKDYEAAQKMIDEGASPDSAPSTLEESRECVPAGERTMLHELCGREQTPENEDWLRKIEFLLDNGADIEWRAYNHEAGNEEHFRHDDLQYFHRTDYCGWTPLMSAVSGGRVETVKLLIEHGADVNAVDFSGCNALFYAARSYKGEDAGEITRILIQNGIDYRKTDNFGQNIWDYLGYYEMEPVEEALREETTWTRYDIEKPQ